MGVCAGRRDWARIHLSAALSSAHPPSHLDYSDSPIRKIDRDECSCYAFMVAVFSALVYGVWPKHLRSKHK